ncbi:hypothetical protein RHSIM_Rhsim03G0140700 [Rhododendron simsii]|uniref:C2 domain-containing protein n=1 Tax=Rhododendron simsii TaxID=118357 RepID=A0A834LR52_RHOSS|nr:hypothetical protein RHSIM_Rhsim03G0140700 [Rhododendron simsii]
MTTSRPPSKPLDLDITIVSAKHLKNVNWRHGDLKPYAIFWVDPDRRLATKSDDSGSTRPVWNERFLLPLPSLHDPSSSLNLEIFHSKPSDTPKPLVATLRVPLSDLPDPDDSARIRTFELRRPSGRPHGKIRIKLALRERPVPDYHITPPPNYYYSTAPPPPPRDYRGYSTAPPAPSPPPPTYPYGGGYADPYSGYYSGGYYSSPQLPPPPQRPFFDRQSTSYGGPSAPVDYAPYDQKQKGAKMGGFGTGLAVGALAGGVGGLVLDEGLKHEEDKVAERVESDLASRDEYSDYRLDYGYN